MLAPLVRALAELDIEPKIDGYSFDINFSGNKARLDQIWNLVRTTGYEFDGSKEDRPQANKSYWSGWFSYKDAELPYARMYMSFSSTICKQVKVGTKMEEVDIYETRCE